MKKITLFTLTVIALNTGFSAFGQDSVGEPVRRPDLPRERLFRECLANPDCTAEKRLHMNLKDCVRPQRAEPPEQKKTVANPLDPYLNPDMEQLNKNKRGWGLDTWAPPEESNPYHSWEWNSK